MAENQRTEAPSLLAIEVGSINSRALLFDAVEGKYRFLAAGLSPTTAGAPVFDVSEGVHLAIDNLHETTGRLLLGPSEDLILPARMDGSGVDRLVATVSAAPPLKVIAIGLLEEASLQSLIRLLGTINADVLETISLNDGSRLEDQLDLILRSRPELVAITGGTDGGAAQSVLRQVDNLALALGMLPVSNRAEVFFCGNKDLAEIVTRKLEPLAPVHVAPNLRPAIDLERLAPAKIRLDAFHRRNITRTLLGAQELDHWSSGTLTSTPTAFGRVIRFLSKVYDPGKGVLGVDLGANATTVAAAFDGDLHLKVHPRLGVGAGLLGLLDNLNLEDLVRWIPYELPDRYVREYLYNKAIHPGTLPATPEDLSIEHALAREALRFAVRASFLDFPRDARRPPLPELLPYFEPLLVSGSVLARAPSYAHSLLIALDGLQPTGITRIILDKNSLTPALGAAATFNATLAVQILESNSFANLGTVISPVGSARLGSPVLRAKVVYESGQENVLEVKYGTLRRIPLPPGNYAHLQIQPLQRFDIGLGGPGRGGRLRVVGSEFGVIIDARGRPLRLLASPERRRETLKRWMAVLGS